MPNESDTRAAIDRTAQRMVEHAQKTGKKITHTEARDRARRAVVQTETRKARR
jgi:hypothetical protein